MDQLRKDNKKQMRLEKLVATKSLPWNTENYLSSGEKYCINVTPK